MEAFMSLENDLFVIEDNFWRGGPEAHQRHADRQCLVAFSEMAGVMANEDIAKSAEKGRWQDVPPKRKDMAQLSDGSAVITRECSAKRKNNQPYHALVSSGYARRADGWKLVSHQQTPLR
jgi:hypothetical protein